MRNCAVALLCIATFGCARGGSRPAPASSTSAAGPSTTAPAPTTTVALPSITASPIAGFDVPAFHASLEKLGFTTAPGSSKPGFVTTTSTRGDATVSTYGTGASDAVKIVAEANLPAAPSVLGTVAMTVASGAEAKKAEAWIKATLKKGPVSADQPRSTSTTFAGQPFVLTVNKSTATLGIGRFTRPL